MTPLQRYQQDLTRDDFAFDAEQQRVVAELEALYQALIHPAPRHWWQGATAIDGLYIWGRVGRGKTYLMDSFFDSLPAGLGLRLHFHRFMQRVHADLRALSGHKNPLDQVAKHLSEEARVLCFDEFFVSDIGDAMILGNLLHALFARGVVLVATSNIAPDGLYRDGLQRQRFLPAIDLLNHYTQVVPLDGEEDHRLRELPAVEDYLHPLSAAVDTKLFDIWQGLSEGMPAISAQLRVLDRTLLTRGRTAAVIWFDFFALCDGPRSQLDYIELSQRYHTLIVSNIPVLGGHVNTRKIAIGTEDTGANKNTIGHVDRSVQQGRLDDPARRFIALVDELYDRHTRLIISAAAPIRELYLGGRVSFEFQRTVSRLIEMQSEDYLEKTKACRKPELR